MTMWRAAIAVAGSLALSAPAAAGAATFTFGANLDATAVDPGASRCNDPVPSYGVPAGIQSCMTSYLGTYPDGLVAPASGTVDAVRVKVGPTTGPMRVNVIRFLFRQNPGDPSHPTSAGPFLEAYGPQFTPAANATTRVPTSLPMQEDPTPALNDGTTIQVIDALALEVNAPNVPLPIFADQGALSYLFYPSPTQQGLAAPSPNGIPGSLLTTGFGVLMSADLSTPAPPIGPPATPPPAPPAGPPVAAPQPPPAAIPPALPVISLPRQTATVKDGAARVALLCQVVDCRGRLTLQSATPATARAAVRSAATKKKQAKTYGAATFSAKAGKTTTVKVKLNRSGRGLLKHKKKATVAAKVTFTTGGGAPKTFRVTLKKG